MFTLDSILTSISLLGSTVAVIASIALYASRKAQRELELRINTLQQDYLGVRKELDIVNASAMGVGRHLAQFERRVMATLKEREGDLPGDSYIPFSEASLLVEKGADTATLMKRCGISKAEAELLHRMHAA